MGLLKGLVIASVAFSLSSVVFASQSAFDSVLTPGARLVAGAPGKNEFYIIGKENEAEYKTIAQAKVQHSKPAALPHIVTAAHKPHINKAMYKIINKYRFVPKMQTALGKTLKQTQKPQTISIAMRKVKHPVAMKKMPHATHLAAKHSIAKVKLASKKSVNKTSKMQMANRKPILHFKIISLAKELAKHQKPHAHLAIKTSNKRWMKAHLTLKKPVHVTPHQQHIMVVL